MFKHTIKSFAEINEPNRLSHNFNFSMGCNPEDAVALSIDFTVIGETEPSEKQYSVIVKMGEVKPVLVTTLYSHEPIVIQDLLKMFVQQLLLGVISPESDVQVKEIIPQLAHVYQQLTGKQVTIDNISIEAPISGKRSIRYQGLSVSVTRCRHFGYADYFTIISYSGSPEPVGEAYIDLTGHIKLRQSSRPSPVVMEEVIGLLDHYLNLQ